VTAFTARHGSPTAAGSRAPGADLLTLGVALAVLAALSSLLGSSGQPAGDPGDAAIRALLLDRSASATRGRPGWQRWAIQRLAAEARGAAENGEDIVLVAFDRGVERRFGPASADEFMGWLRRGDAAGGLRSSTAGDLGTDLVGASEVALEVIGGGDRPPGEVVILGDGRAAAGQLPEALLDPMVRAVRLVEPPAALLPDVGVRALHLPDPAEPGARIPVRLDLFVDGALPAGGDEPALIVEWELRFRSSTKMEASRTIRGREEAAVPATARAAAGLRSLSVNVELPPLSTGVGELGVAVRLSALPPEVPDLFPENDRAAGLLEVGAPVRVLVVQPGGAEAAGGTGRLGSRRGGLQGEAFDGIDFDFIGPGDLRPRLLGDDPPDVVVTLDVPLAGLPGAALSRFVLAGGGWLRCAGWTALREDGPELEPLLALVPDREPRQPMDVVFLVDGSGSMGGQRWERVRDALGAVVPTTAARDRMELRFFTQVVTQPKLVFEASADRGPERALERREAVEGLVRARVPGGSTDILYSLDGLAAARERGLLASSSGGPAGDPAGDPAGERAQGMIVLITDGLTDSVWSLRRQVRDRIAAAGDRLVIVQVGEDPDGVEFLAGLLMDGEAVLEAGELEGLEDLLHQELQDVRLVEGATVVAAPALPGAAWLAELRGPVLDAAALERSLVLGQVLRSRPAEGATALLDVAVSPAAPVAGGGPGRGTLIALAERGQGTVAGLAVPALGSGPEAWSPALRSRIGWLAPVLRAMARRHSEAARRAPASEAGPGGRPRGSLTAGGEVLVRGLPNGLPASFLAAITGAPTVDLFGELGARKRLASVRLTVPEVESAPDRVRRGLRPSALDAVPRGTPLLIELPPPAVAVPLRADGPAEAFPPPGGAAPSLRHGLGRSGGAAGPASPPSDTDRGWPHPLTPWLLWAAIGSLFLGALGGRPGLAALVGGRNQHSPGGQGSRSGLE